MTTSRPDVVAGSPRLSEGNSPLSLVKLPTSWGSAPPDLEQSSSHQDPITGKSNSKQPDFGNVSFSPPSSLQLSDPYSHNLISTTTTTTTVAQFLFAAAAASTAVSQMHNQSLMMPKFTMTTTAANSESQHQGGSWRTGQQHHSFSIADHIRSDDYAENAENNVVAALITGGGCGRGFGSSTLAKAPSSVSCPVCHNELCSKDLSAHVLLELDALNSETQALQGGCKESNPFERCLGLPTVTTSTNDVLDKISSNQRYYNFQMLKQRRLSRRTAIIRNDYDSNVHQIPPAPSPKTSMFNITELVPSFPSGGGLTFDLAAGTSETAFTSSASASSTYFPPTPSAGANPNKLRRLEK